MTVCFDFNIVEPHIFLFPKALALTTLVFNVRQVILSVDGFPEEKSKSVMKYHLPTMHTKIIKFYCYD